MELKQIPLNKIKPNPLQPREHFDREKLKELAESILSNGIINPIQVRKKGNIYEIVAGERRWKASQIAKLKKIPAIIKIYKKEGDVAVESLIENIHREDLSEVEKTKFLKQIMKLENIISITDLSKKVSIPRRTIYRWFRITGIREILPAGVAQKVSQTQIESTEGLEREDKIKVLKKAGEKEWGHTKIRKVSKLIPKATDNIKKALIEDQIEPEVAEAIVEIKEPEIQEKVFKEVQKVQKKKVKATPEKIKEIKEEIELLKGWENLRIKKTPHDFVNMITNNLMKINDLMPSDPRKINLVVQVLSSEEYKNYGKGLLKTLENTLKRNILPFYKELKESLQ